MKTRRLILKLMMAMVLSSGCSQSDCIRYPNTQGSNGQKCSWMDIKPGELFWNETTDLTLQLDEPILNTRLRSGAAAEIRINNKDTGAPIVLTSCGARLSPLLGSDEEIPKFRLSTVGASLLSEKLGPIELELSAEGRSASSSLMLRGPYDRPPAFINFSYPPTSALLWAGFAPGARGGEFAFTLQSSESGKPYPLSLRLCTPTVAISGDYRCDNDPTITKIFDLTVNPYLTAGGKESVVFASTDLNGTLLSQVKSPGMPSALTKKDYFRVTQMAMDRNGDLLLLAGQEIRGPSFWGYSISERADVTLNNLPPDLSSGLQNIAVGDIDSDGMPEGIILRNVQGAQRIEVLSGAGSRAPTWMWNSSSSDELSALLTTNSLRMEGVAMAVADVDGDQKNELLLLGIATPSSPTEPERWMLAIFQKAADACSLPLVLVELQSPRTSSGKPLDLSVGYLGNTKTMELLITTGTRRADGTIESPAHYIYRHKAP